MLGSTRQLMKEVIASNRCICNTASDLSSPPYAISVCHNCLRTLKSCQIMRKISLLITYVAVERPVSNFLLSERTRVVSLFSFFLCIWYNF